MISLKTKRLILRHWDASDLAPFAEMNADPKVREFFPSLLTKEENDLSVQNFRSHIDKLGWGFWAASIIETQEFIGFIGLQNVSFAAPFSKLPAVEIGWRLSFKHWGHGFATEGAIAALNFGFNTLELPEIVSFTAEKNVRSRHVMEKIGMEQDVKGGFDHPNIPLYNPLRKQVLYRIDRGKFQMASRL